MDIIVGDEMNIPEDLQTMYNHYLDLATKDVERAQVSPEMMLALIERIGDLETDSENLESYVHYECRKKLKSETERFEKELDEARYDNMGREKS